MIKKHINGFLILLFLGFFANTYYLYKSNQELKESLSISKSNEKAFMSENSVLQESNRLFKFNIEQLNYYNDSIMVKLNKAKAESKIKDNQITQLQYSLDNFNKKDTIVFRDTIFRDTTIKLDTLIRNKWYSINLGLKYPSTISTDISVSSEKVVIISTKKETIDPPKKFWLWRLFQKKHRVAKIDVIEGNPYIETKQQRFIEIIQ